MRSIILSQNCIFIYMYRLDRIKRDVRSPMLRDTRITIGCACYSDLVEMFQASLSEFGQLRC